MTWHHRGKDAGSACYFVFVLILTFLRRKLRNVKRDWGCFRDLLKTQFSFSSSNTYIRHCLHLSHSLLYLMHNTSMRSHQIWVIQLCSFFSCWSCLFACYISRRWVGGSWSITTQVVQALSVKCRQKALQFWWQECVCEDNQTAAIVTVYACWDTLKTGCSNPYRYHWIIHFPPHSLK